MTGLGSGLMGVVVLAAACAQAGQGDDGNNPDSRLFVPPDAPGGGGADAFVPGTPDAFVPATPDAAPMCTVQTVQVLLNPSFDGTPAGVSWTQIPADPTYPLIGLPPGGVTPLSPPNIVWMGGLPSATDRLYQDVAIPATATALELRLNRWIATEELSGQFDFLFVQLTTPADVLLASLATWSNANSSTSFVAANLPSPSPYAGQTVRVHFRSTTDSTLNTNFFLDSVQLLVTACL
jgi:hypothetical protein